MSKACEADTKVITKVVRDTDEFSHIEFIDKSKKKKGCIFYDCSVAGITPISKPAGFYKVKNAAFCEQMESPKLCDLKKDWLYPCSKRENKKVVSFIKDNLKKNQSIMNEETFNILSRIVDNYEFERAIEE